MAEGAASTVLAGETNWSTGGKEGREGEVFGTTPIERGLSSGHGATGIEDFSDLGVDLEIGGDGGEGNPEFGDFFRGNCGGHFLQEGRAGEGRMDAGLDFADDLAGFLEGFLRNGIDLVPDFLDLLLCDQTGVEEAAGEETADRGVGIDFGIEGGLGEVRFISFVVAVATVTNDIEDDVFMKLLAEFEGKLNDRSGGQGIVSVHVKDGQAECFSRGGAVSGGAGIVRQGGEGDLIIDDDMDRSSGAIPF